MEMKKYFFISYMTKISREDALRYGVIQNDTEIFSGVYEVSDPILYFAELSKIIKKNEIRDACLLHFSEITKDQYDAYIRI